MISRNFRSSLFRAGPSPMRSCARCSTALISRKIQLPASASLATVIHMATEGLGIAVIPTAIVENELADGRLLQLSTDLKIAPLTFSASWLASPDTLAVELVADLAGKIAQDSAAVIDSAAASTS